MFRKFLPAVALAAALVAPVAAFAAVDVDNILFDNGTGNVTVSAGSQVHETIYVKNDTSNDVESIFVRYLNAGGLAEQGRCYDVADQIGVAPINGWAIGVNVDTPSSAGTWTQEVSVFGTNGDAADQSCSTSADDSTTFSARVTTVAPNSTGNPTGNSGGTQSPAPWEAAIAALTAQVTNLSNLFAKLASSTQNAPAPTVPAICAQFTAAASGGTFSLQTFLKDQGYMTSAQIATGPGIYGPRTTAAVANFRLATHCN